MSSMCQPHSRLWGQHGEQDRVTSVFMELTSSWAKIYNEQRRADQMGERYARNETENYARSDWRKVLWFVESEQASLRR